MNIAQKTIQVFVPVEETAGLQDETLIPYQPGFVCIEWMDIQVIAPNIVQRHAQVRKTAG